MAASDFNDLNSKDINSILDKIDALLLASNLTPDMEAKAANTSLAQEDEMRAAGFGDAQLEEIKKGKEAELPVELYAKPCYNWMQMYEIRMGLMENLATELYESPLYSANQMHQIRLGLSDHLDVTSYASLVLSSTDMQLVRKALFAQAYKEHPKRYGHSYRDDTTGIMLRISEDSMQAFITIPPGLPEKVSANDIIDALENHDITYGLLKDKIKKIAAEQIIDHEICVAHGKRPTIGKAGWYELYFENEIEKSHIVAPDDEVDYSDVRTVDAIVPGKPLVKYHPAEKDVGGITVTNIPVFGIVGEDLPPLTGSGIEFIPDDNTYISTAYGYASFNGTTSSLNVWKIYEIHGDISYFQSLSYDGTVHVFGSVRSSSVIRAEGDVIIDGSVENASVYSDHDIVVKGGVNNGEQGVIEAGGAVRGKFFENTTINAGGIVESNYFLNCTIHTDDRLVARGKKARIIGGHIEAVVGVEAVLIANYLSTKTLFIVGDIAGVEKRLAVCNRNRRQIATELEQLNAGKEKLILLLGEDQVRGNALYEKTAAAIQIKEEQAAKCDKEISQLKVIVKRAEKAYVRVRGELQVDVVFIINGIRKKIEQQISHGILLTREKLTHKK